MALFFLRVCLSGELWTDPQIPNTAQRLPLFSSLRLLGDDAMTATVNNAGNGVCGIRLMTRFYGCTVVYVLDTYLLDTTSSRRAGRRAPEGRVFLLVSLLFLRSANQ